MEIFAGWFFLIGGLAGVFTASRAKTFSWANDVDGTVTEEDRKREVPITRIRRWTIVTICILIACYGAIQIQRHYRWKVLATSTVSQPSEH